jgi:hypothetical protein
LYSSPPSMNAYPSSAWLKACLFSLPIHHLPIHIPLSPTSMICGRACFFAPYPREDPPCLHHSIAISEWEASLAAARQPTFQPTSSIH